MAITLADVVRLPEPVTLLDGRTITIKPATLRMRGFLRAMQEAAEGSPEQDAAIVGAVRLAAPELSEDEIADLTPAELMTILASTQGTLAAVLGALGNAAGPAEATDAASPRPSPLTTTSSS